MKDSEIVRRIKSIPGIEQLNTLQVEAMEAGGRQLVIVAPTGSGKTVAFGARILRILEQAGEGIRCIVIAPSRELVLQTESVMKTLAKGYKVAAMYGGHRMSDEVSSLAPVPDLIVATPGRFLDHLQRGTLEPPKRLILLVIDEYDKALQLGFEGEMKRIMRRLGSPVNLVLTSATEMDAFPEYLGLKNPDFIQAERQGSGRLEVVTVESFSRDKLDSLTALLKSTEVGARALVFVNHRESAERVYRNLKKENIPAGLYHGALDQQQREMAVDMFANGTTPVLVATDLAARGLDIAGVDSVIHYHLPVDRAAWTHRNGRTARQDASGRAFVIVSEADNRPDYINADRAYQPSGDSEAYTCGGVATLYFSAGKKEKISKGDILGFILAHSGLGSREIGKINVHDHYSLAAVPYSMSRDLVKRLVSEKLKGRKVKVSRVNI